MAPHTRPSPRMSDNAFVCRLCFSSSSDLEWKEKHEIKIITFSYLFLPSEFSPPLRTRKDMPTASLDIIRPRFGMSRLPFEFLLHPFGQPDARERRRIRRALPR